MTDEKPAPRSSLYPKYVEPMQGDLVEPAKDWQKNLELGIRLAVKNLVKKVANNEEIAIGLRAILKKDKFGEQDLLDVLLVPFLKDCEGDHDRRYVAYETMSKVYPEFNSLDSTRKCNRRLPNLIIVNFVRRAKA